jgi:hypothetical protein
MISYTELDEEWGQVSPFFSRRMAQKKRRQEDRLPPPPVFTTPYLLSA